MIRRPCRPRPRQFGGMAVSMTKMSVPMTEMCIRSDSDGRADAAADGHADMGWFACLYHVSKLKHTYTHMSGYMSWHICTQGPSDKGWFAGLYKCLSACRNTCLDSRLNMAPSGTGPSVYACINASMRPSVHPSHSLTHSSIHPSSLGAAVHPPRVAAARFHSSAVWLPSLHGFSDIPF